MMRKRKLKAILLMLGKSMIIVGKIHTKYKITFKDSKIKNN